MSKQNTKNRAEVAPKRTQPPVKYQPEMRMGFEFHLGDWNVSVYLRHEDMNDRRGSRR